MPRALRLGSMGVRISAACIGMMYGPNVPIVAVVFSGGAVMAYSLELLLSAWLTRMPRSVLFEIFSLIYTMPSSFELN
jgi:hypothetical protein